MNAQAPTADNAASRALERDWWLRVPAVLLSPRAVFAALRDDSSAAAEARAEPVATLVLLSGIGGVLAAGVASTLMNSPAIDELVVAVLVLLTGTVYGLATYWVGGGLLQAGLRGAGGTGSYRRARHLLAFAAAPLALSLLVVWPLRFAVYGNDIFETGGADALGSGRHLFNALEAGFALWSAVLLVIGVRAVESWNVGRALVALALALLVPLLFALPLVASLAGR